MMRSKPPGVALQKTYDDCHLVCSTAIYFESQNNEGEALRCWRNALEQINYHNAFRIPSGYHPRSETEKALQASLRELELQCKERVDLLGALEQSRKESSNSTTATDMMRPPARVDNETWLGSGTIRPLNYPDLARPPPLPKRPLQTRSSSSDGAAVSKTLSRSFSPLPPKKPARTPSPEKKIRMRSTLRSSKPRNDSSSSTLSAIAKDRPPAASKAATQAWASTARTEYSRITPIVPRSAGASSDVEDVLARISFSSIKPVNISTATEANVRLRPMPAQEKGGGGREAQSASEKHGYGQVNVSHSGSPPLERFAVSRQKPLGLIYYSDSDQEISLPPSRHQRTGRRTALPSGMHNTHSPKIRGKRLLRSAAVSPRTSSIQNKSNGHIIPTIDLHVSAEDEPSRSADFSIARKSIRHQAPNTFSGKDVSCEDSDDVLGLYSEDCHRESESHSSESSPSGLLTDEESWKRIAEQVLDNLPRGVDQGASEQILNEVIIHGDEVHWGDIAGLEVAKSALKETVVYPFLRPDLFMGLREPARGMLLFGPPGTGKTMLARAVATESKSTFFAISASSLTSKFLGESEKLVRALFAIAKVLAPSIIFVDEIDSLLSSRNESGEHEASRRIKTEFLIQWSDLAKAAAGRDQSKDKDREDASRVLVLAATNSPWAIDDAARRRFVRRQYIPLPEDHVRHLQLKTLLAYQKHELTDADIAQLVELTDGFSGSDITALAKDAAMGPLRSLGEKLLDMTMDEIGPINIEDFVASLRTIRPSVSKEGLQRFEDWARDYGERGG